LRLAANSNSNTWVERVRHRRLLGDCPGECDGCRTISSRKTLAQAK
jgi:hypothetical protein